MFMRAGGWIRRAGAAVAVLLAACARELPKEDLHTARTRGLVFLAMDQLEEAETEFRTVTALAPDDPLGYANLGLVHLRAGRLREAEKALRRALDRDSTAIAPVLTLAKVFELTGQREKARLLLEPRLGPPPEDPRVLYALADLGDSAQGSAGSDRQKYLKRLVNRSPDNLSARLALAEDYLRRGNSSAAALELEALRQLPPDLPKEALPLFERTLRLLRAAQTDSARVPFGRFREIMEVTPPYQASLQALESPLGPRAGYPVLTFRPFYEIRERLTRASDSTPPAMEFRDATAQSGLDQLAVRPPGAAPAGGDRFAVAAGDYDGDGNDDLFVAGHLYRGEYSRFVEVAASGIDEAAHATWAGFADYDNDGRLDLAILDADGALRVLHNQSGEKRDAFRDLTRGARLAGVRGGRDAAFVDLDHDGDLDIVLATSSGVRFFRNNLDGSFRDVSIEARLTPPGQSENPTSVTFGDFTGDGRIDLVVTDADRGVMLLRNRGGLGFEDATAGSGIERAAGAQAAAVGDYDNDGLLDLAMVGSGKVPILYHNQGGGAFTSDLRSSKALGALGESALTRARFFDYDNDGFLDLVLAGPGLFLLHNDGSGRFDDRSALLPATARSGAALTMSDADRDGDVDLLVIGRSDGEGARLRLLRNDGGNFNQYVRIELKALGAGSGKNNAFGIGTRLDLRVGELYQTRVTTTPVTYFGMGRHLKADVLRVVWPNGVPQAIYFPGTDQTVLEEEVLKSSCLFLYAWDGSAFRFVTDVMWRSALGMPVGIGGGGRAAYAPAGASREYLRIAGAQLEPRNGRYTLHLTEELWETSYLDQVKLVAVDHPDSVTVHVDERFVPPAPTALRLYQVARPRAPLSATDGDGADLLPALRAQDDVYTAGATPGRFQGVTEPHEMILDTGPGGARDSLLLFLRGWVFPTDASINVALSQSAGSGPIPPSLEVRDAQGRWRAVIPDLGFPSGKDKTLIANLAGIFPTADRRVRIRTSMDIHWDQAFLASPVSRSPVRISPLDPAAADLHYRGFSRMYRKGGRAGPHWFDYGDVSKEARWLPIDGRLTRFGNVLPLLGESDDRYVVMGPGDEATVEFSADALPPLAPGWTRDFLIYSVGWIKDGDFNTAHGGTVEPLPFHGITRYPYAAGDRYPVDKSHREYLETYNTRPGAGPPR